MADVIIFDASDSNPNSLGNRLLVFTDANIGYFFCIPAAGNKVSYKKTVDGGATWGAAVDMFVGGSGVVSAIGVWYDGWTPDDPGTVIHVWWLDTGGDNVDYRQLDTAGDILGTQRTVFDGGAVSQGSYGIFVSGAKMRGGNLVCCFDDGTDLGTYRSTDGGETWTERANAVEAGSDVASVFPGNEADPQDAWILYHDASASELTLKVHVDSADAIVESDPLATVVIFNNFSLGPYSFSGAIRPSDGHLIAVAWTEVDTSTADFLAWDIGGVDSIAALAALAVNKDDCFHPGVFVSGAGHIYVAFVGKRDGSETLHTNAGVYYAKSIDGGLTWSADAAYSATASNWTQTWVPLNGARFAVAWRKPTAEDLLTNAANSVLPAEPDLGPPCRFCADAGHTHLLSAHQGLGGVCEVLPEDPNEYADRCPRYVPSDDSAYPDSGAASVQIPGITYRFFQQEPASPALPIIIEAYYPSRKRGRGGRLVTQIVDPGFKYLWGGPDDSAPSARSPVHGVSYNAKGWDGVVSLKRVNKKSRNFLLGRGVPQATVDAFLDFSHGYTWDDEAHAGQLGRDIDEAMTDRLAAFRACGANSWQSNAANSVDPRSLTVNFHGIPFEVSGVWVAGAMYGDQNRIECVVVHVNNYVQGGDPSASVLSVTAPAILRWEIGNWLAWKGGYRPKSTPKNDLGANDPCACANPSGGACYSNS